MMEPPLLSIRPRRPEEYRDSMQHPSFKKWGDSHGEKSYSTRGIHGQTERIRALPMRLWGVHGERWGVHGELRLLGRLRDDYALSLRKSGGSMKEFLCCPYCLVRLVFLRHRLVGLLWLSRPWRDSGCRYWPGVTCRESPRTRVDRPLGRAPQPQLRDRPRPARLRRGALSGRSSTVTSWATR